MGRKPKQEKPPFGKHLEKLRLNAGLSLEDAAKLIGTTHQQVSRWETRGVIGHHRFALAMAKAYRVNIPTLLHIDTLKNIAEDMTPEERELAKFVFTVKKQRPGDLGKLISLMKSTWKAFCKQQKL